MPHQSEWLRLMFVRTRPGAACKAAPSGSLMGPIISRAERAYSNAKSAPSTLHAVPLCSAEAADLTVASAAEAG